MADMTERAEDKPTGVVCCFEKERKRGKTRKIFLAQTRVGKDIRRALPHGIPTRSFKKMVEFNSKQTHKAWRMLWPIYAEDG